MNDITQFKKTLQKLPPFNGLPDEVLTAIGRSAARRRFSTGQIIFVEGEPAESIFILEEGWIKATRMTREGREQAMMFLNPIDIFGDIGLYTGATYPGTTMALEPVSVWIIPGKTILDLIPRYPDLAMAVIRHLAVRVLHYISLVEDLSLRSVEARLAKSLLRNAQELNGQLIVPRRGWTTFDEMAVRLGTVRDVLSRALKSLEAEKLLKVEKQAIILLDPTGLAERSDR